MPERTLEVEMREIRAGEKSAGKKSTTGKSAQSGVGAQSDRKKSTRKGTGTETAQKKSAQKSGARQGAGVRRAGKKRAASGGAARPGAEAPAAEQGLARNAAQEQAIRTTEGPVLLISCPGSGKTTTLIRRIHQILESGVDPHQVLMVTFTRAAADQMRERYLQFYGRNPGVVFMTIHSLCFNLLKAQGLYRADQILDQRGEFSYLIEKVRHYRWAQDPWEITTELVREFSALRMSRQDIGSYKPSACQNPAFTNLFEGYEQYKLDNHLIDYDDMLLRCEEMLRHNARVRVKWQEQFRYIQCDEYQDTNAVQRDILYMLSARGHNLCVVGDDDQSIYRFRGASPEIMLGFPRDFPETKVIRMSTNYRCSARIVAASARLILHNSERFDKEFSAARPEGDAVEVVRATNKGEEMQQLAERIAARHAEGIDYADMAVLFRTNAQASLPVLRLQEAGIPCYSTERVKSVYDGWIFGDIRAYADLALGVGTNEELLRVLNRPMRFLKEEAFRDVPFTRRGLTSAISYLDTGEEDGWKYREADKRIEQWLAVLGPGRLTAGDRPGKLFAALDGSSGLSYSDYLKNSAQFRGLDPSGFLEELQTIRSLAEGCGSIGEWLGKVDRSRQMLRDRGRLRDEGGVRLMTMHRAKGLEWNTVFVVDCNAKVLPHVQSEGDERALQEERRLLYVAMTRARDRLVLMTGSREPSPFLAEIFPAEGKRKRR